MYSSISPSAPRERISSPLPMMCRSLPSARFSSLTAVLRSPSSRVELGQGRGGVSVRETTYFGVLLRAARNGLSCVFQ